MPFMPAMYRIKIKPDPVEEVTAGGIILAQQTRDKDQSAAVTGTVIAVGPSAFDGAEVLKPGDRILYAKYGGLVFKEGEQDFRFINDEDYIGLWKEEEATNG